MFSKSSNNSPWIHIRASSELVKLVYEPEHNLNRRLHQRNRRVLFEQRDERPAQPRIVYLPILDINYFCYFLDILKNYNPMDDEPMLAADCVVAPTLGSAITISETTNEFTIKDASEYWSAAPKQQQQMIPQTTAISNIKLPILKKEEYDIWAMEMEHYLEYIDNEVWKSLTAKAEIQAVEKERKAKNILLMAIPKEHMRRFHGMDDAKEIWEAIRTRLGHSFYFVQPIFLKKEVRYAGFAAEVLLSLIGQTNRDLDLLLKILEQIDDVDIEEMDINWQIAMIAIRMKKFYKKTGRRVRVDGKTPIGFDKKKLECFNCYNIGHFAREQEKRIKMGLAKMDDGNVNWGEHTEQKKQNHVLMRYHSSNDKVSLGFEIKSNNEVLSFEEEMNFSVFKCSKEDSIGKPSYSRFTKTNDFKGVPHPLSGDYTPKPQEEIDDSLYVYGKKGPQKPKMSVTDKNSSEHSTYQSNDNEGSCENTSLSIFLRSSQKVLDNQNEMF
ncbi:hypothetical protein Tco_0821313 [Tanacetum coccineum]|uniref:Uncharacterized protein n=2 Tax=Tanacetum coccineum TaxID=301880 RepID=A0ABQ5AGN5_9ASTR